MITTVTADNCFDFRGLSTDTKPIGSDTIGGNVSFVIANGSTFFEMDTSTAYMYSITIEAGARKGEWLKI